MQMYEPAMRQEARRLIAEHGELVEVRCVSGPPDYRIELVFADGHEETITRHSGRIDITMMKFGYMGTGTRCFHVFLNEAGFKDVSLEQLATMEGPQVLRKGKQPEEAIVEEEPKAPGPAKPPGEETELPHWAEVSRDPSLVNPLILEKLEKSMCFMVRDEAGPVAALIIRALSEEFRGSLTAATPMSLYVHHYKAPSCDLYGVYPIVWDDPKEPFFKETWMVGAGSVTGPPDPLSEGELSRLEALLSQKYTYFLMVDRSNHLVAARRVNYSPETQKHFLGLLPKAGAARSVTISNVELISALQEYMSRVSLEQVRAAARRLSVAKAEPREEETRLLIRPEVEGERVYPWSGMSRAYRVALVLAALVWLCLVGRAMNAAAQDPIVYLIFAVILLVPPARAIFDALRPTTMRELVISPERKVIFRRKSGQEKPVIAKIDRVAATMRGKAILIQGLSPGGKKVRAQVAKGNLEEGDFERFKEDLQRLIPGVTITPVPTRALPVRSIFAGITAVLGVLFLAGFLFTTAATVHDYVKGLEFERIPFQTQVTIILALLAAFLLFAGLSIFLTERRKIGILFWSGLVGLGVMGTGYVMAYVWEGGLLREALPSVPITATSVPTPTVGSTPEATPTPRPTSSPTGVITYTVQAGDTLGGIAAEFGVTVEAIVEANDIEDPSLINVGQVLVIPQP